MTRAPIASDTNTMADATIFDLIVIGDEPAILEGLEKTYDCNEYGFRVVAYCEKRGKGSLSGV